MSIKMTIEVSLEQAVRIAEILGNTGTFKDAPTAAPAAVPDIPAVQTAPVVPTIPTAPIAPAAAPSAASIVPAAPPAVSAVPLAQPAVPNVPAAPPTAVKKYTADELSVASRPLVEAGKQPEVLALLHSFTFTDANGVTRNVQNIREMPEELYPAFANGIRQLGGRI